jgi:predicted DCC family thiol-disulfide oxidoreductase YuxK
MGSPLTWFERRLRRRNPVPGGRQLEERTPRGARSSSVGRGAKPPSEAVLIYDAECPMCRAAALWLMRLALSQHRLEILPCRSPLRAERFPSITDDACMGAMQLVLPDGRVVAGADAVPELLRRIHGLGWLAAVFAVPGMRPAARLVYGWIARNRMRISCAVRR